jgi:GAF domain-containing protein
VSATDSVSGALEAVQQRTGDGPCVDSLVLDEVIHCSDLAEETRWPAVREALVPLEARAIIGMPIHVGGNSVGSLNLYRKVVHEWDEEERSGIRAYADVIEHLLAIAVLADERQELAEQLRHALEHRVVVERAIGFLMASQSIDAVRAFDVLRSQARHERRKVAELAADLLSRRQGSVTRA